MGRILTAVPPGPKLKKIRYCGASPNLIVRTDRINQIIIAGDERWRKKWGGKKKPRTVEDMEDKGLPVNKRARLVIPGTL